MLPLRGDHVDAWLAWPDIVAAPTLETCRALLSEQERTTHDRFHFAHDRATYAVAHALVRRALSRYCEVAPAEWRFVTDAHGRPHVAPGSPPIAFNLSHTRGLSACIVGGASAIGVDVDEMRDLDALFEVADHSFASAEVSDLAPPNHA